MMMLVILCAWLGRAWPDYHQPHVDFLHPMIVFEDFSKELVARALVHSDEMLLV